MVCYQRKIRPYEIRWRGHPQRQPGTRDNCGLEMFLRERNRPSPWTVDGQTPSQPEPLMAIIRSQITSHKPRQELCSRCVVYIGCRVAMATKRGEPACLLRVEEAPPFLVDFRQLRAASDPTPRNGIHGVAVRLVRSQYLLAFKQWTS